MDQQVPWYRTENGSHPYKLIARTKAQDHDAAASTNSFQAVAVFPWNRHSLSQLWNGKFVHRQDEWNALVSKWTGAVAVGGGRKLRVFVTRPNEPFVPLFAVEIPDESASIRAITWCIVEKGPKTITGFTPLVAFAGDRIIYILNVNTRTFHGVLKGHGGNITSLAVHPLDPSTMCSTSFDHSTRIYDLEKKTPDKAINPSWPGSDKPSYGGFAFGLRDRGGEGAGYGQWVAVLAGGPSGGHQDAVLCAAFHSTFPIIATSGADHCVKLWRTPKLDGVFVSRDDKPLFSSSIVHSAPVRSISWLNQDTLFSHSDPIIFRNPDKTLRNAQGTLVIWRWLGLDRFFTLDRNSWPDVMRGCASDYLESASFKVITEYNVPPPIESTQLRVHQSPYHPPLILIPSEGGIRIGSTLYFRPRKPPPFPDDTEEMTREVESMTLSSADQGMPDREEDIVKWHVSTEQDVRVLACALDERGDLLVGVGEQESIWIWRQR